MRKFTLAMVAVFAAEVMSAQLFEVGVTREVSLPQGVSVEQAVINKAGTRVAYVDMHGTGLQLMDLTTGSNVAVSSKGVGLDLTFTPDGNTLVYDEVSYDSRHARKVAVKAYNIATRKNSTVVSDSRTLNGVSVNNNSVTAIENGRQRVHKIVKEDNQSPILSINLGQLCITRNGVTTVLSPLGTAGMSYMWPTLSPDGNKICFYAAGMGCYTCNLDGSDVKKLGWLRAAQWYDNTTVVGMHDLTDGRFITESSIVAKSADGAVSQTLVDSSKVALYPTVAKGKIAYNTVDGRLFIVDVTKK